MSDISKHQAQIDALKDVGALFYERGWSYSTSSNYSVVLDREPLRILITASGKDKRSLTDQDFVIVGPDGCAVNPDDQKPSAETLLHVVLAQQPNVGSVLHTHSMWGTVLSDVFFKDGGIQIQGFEMIKGLSGRQSHEETEFVEIFENTQDIPKLADELRRRIAGKGRVLQHGLLMRRHGLYTWGRDLGEARRHIETFEFLFEVLGRRLTLNATT